MKKCYSALSIVAPSGSNIVCGLKTLEIRSWQPEHLPLKDLVIVENQRYLHESGDEDTGRAVAMVDVYDVHAWTETEVEQAQATYWAAGYWAWRLENIRMIDWDIPVPAKRDIYLIEIDHP
ncbi:ASCH domain-containing protein [Acinetobacter sp. YH12128]|uniref:ASCH domain-containing protein n=1 Tax=Acinetobacter sp. YH12128 TaxID=2601113 RepID=UPI0015D0EA46|nr:ASCH domain-containing protein [Acinetobacter sp. YH12128]